MHQLQRTVRGEPSFILEDYFAGRTRAWGMFVNRFGSIRRQFSVDIIGDIEDGKLILTENFTFDDGERSQRVWRITALGEGRYLGSADDVVGAAKGEVTGNRLRWSYDLNLTIGQREWRVHFDDIMILQDNQILLNRASMSKYGVNLGEVIIFFQKEIELAKGNVADVQPVEPNVSRETRVNGATAAAVSA